MFQAVARQISARRTTLTSVGAMMGSQVAAAVIGIASGVLQATFVPPETLGYFAAFAILGSYLTFLHMGSLTALSREYPYWMGKGDPARAQRVASVAQGWVLLVCIAVALLYLVLVVISVARGDYRAAAAWGANLVMASLMNYALYLGCTYRTNSDFVTWSKISLAGAVSSAATLPLVAWLGFWGLCFRTALPALFTAWLSHHNRPVRVQPVLSFREFGALVKFGLLMDTAGFFSTSCMLATMSTIVLGKYGVAVLGLFAFARYAESVMTQFALSIEQVFVPRINHHMGVTESMRQCARYSIRPTIAGTLIVLMGIGVAVTVARPLIGWLTPKYVEAVPIFCVLLFSGLYPVLMIPAQPLIAAKHTYPITAGHLVCYGVFVTLAGSSAWIGLPSFWIAVSYVAGKAAAVVVCYVSLWWQLRRDVLTPVPEYAAAQ